MKRILLTITFCLIAASAYPSSKETAWKMHNRLTGVPPSSEVLAKMTEHIDNGEAEKAAELSMQNRNFYEVVLKNWVKPWSNQDQSSKFDLNDYVATVLGVIRDEIPFTKVLYDDILYVVNDPSINGYSTKDNNHYRGAEKKRLNLKNLLTKKKQSQVTGLPEKAIAGVTTTRASGEEFFLGGTNRRINRFIFINYLCHDFEELHDTTVPDYRVRRDIERNPGGDSRTYKNKCVGCHAGPDALAGAYAHHNYISKDLEYDDSKVDPKMNRNNNYEEGFITKDDSWINLWATGQNAKLGWRGEMQGRGAASLGKMFSQSKAFSQCMANKVFKLVCIKDPSDSEDKKFVQAMADQFEHNGEYNMKKLIRKTSAGCIK